jgi:ATP-binding cassette subfamily B protein
MKRKVKIKQRDITDCGAACLASVSIHYKLQYPISRIRQYAGTDKRGTNVLGLIEAAERLGFQAKGAKGQLENLSGIPLPAIVHIILKSGLHHYVVIYSVSKNTVVYMDPGDGDFHKLSLDQFKEIWTGVLVLLLPGADFVAGKHKTSNTERFWKLIQPHASIMLQALIGAAVYTILGLSTSIYLQKIIDFVLVEGNVRLLNLLSIAMIVILIFQLIIGGYKTVFGLQTGQMIDIRLIMGYYKHLLHLPQRFFDTMRVGEIISRVNDAVKIREFINSVALSFIVNGFIVVFSILLMFFYYWKLALLLLAIIPFYMLLYWITNRINKKWQRQLMEDSAELESQMVESLNAVGTIKRFGLERFTNEKTEGRFITLLRTIYKMSMYSLYVGTGTEFITRLFTILLLWIGSGFVISNELSTGELLSFYALIGYFTGPASSLISANRSIQDALIAADRLFEIIDLETEATHENKVELSTDQIGDIEFHEVCFRYENRQSVFNGLNLRITKGTTTAIVGESGSGKSTLLSLLQNLYPLQSGCITIGGLDLQHISNRSLRQLVGVVPQDIDLFSGTILENIAIGEDEPDLGRIIFLSKKLGTDEFIEKLPNSYNSRVVEQGTNFSGGQKQRLAIARALYRNPEILILDEATSSLDPASEQKVQDTLNWFKAQGKTILLIAHRLSTVKHCDQILVLNKGTLVEQGNHFELLENQGLYSRLWNHHSGSTHQL